MQSVSNNSGLDPAFALDSRPAGTLRLDQINIDEHSVYIFDFDGVVSSRMDDDIYKLAPTDDEVSLLLQAAEHFGIRCDGMEQRYQRHLLYQAAAWFLKIPVEPGPAFLHAKSSGQCAQLFILTARSGWHAVERLRKFVSSTGISPIEIYNVGRVRKDRQLELICREFGFKQVFYVEDSIAHLADASLIAVKNLNLVYIEAASQPERDEVDLRRHFTETVESAISVYRGAERDGHRDF